MVVTELQIYSRHDSLLSPALLLSHLRPLLSAGAVTSPNVAVVSSPSGGHNELSSTAQLGAVSSPSAAALSARPTFLKIKIEIRTGYSIIRDWIPESGIRVSIIKIGSAIGY